MCEIAYEIFESKGRDVHLDAKIGNRKRSIRAYCPLTMFAIPLLLSSPFISGYLLAESFPFRDFEAVR